MRRNVLALLCIEQFRAMPIARVYVPRSTAAGRVHRGWRARTRARVRDVPDPTAARGDRRALVRGGVLADDLLLGDVGARGGGRRPARGGAQVACAAAAGGEDGGWGAGGVGLAPAGGGEVVWARVGAGVAREGRLADVAEAAATGGLHCMVSGRLLESGEKHTKASRPREVERSSDMMMDKDK